MQGRLDIAVWVVGAAATFAWLLFEMAQTGIGWHWIFYLPLCMLMALAWPVTLLVLLPLSHLTAGA